MDYLETQINKHAEQAVHFTDLGSALQKKLYHQLSVKLAEVAQVPFFQEGDQLLGLYENLVKKVASKLNQLSFARFANAAAAQKPDGNAALELLEDVSKMVEEDQQATTFINMSRARLLLKAGKSVEAKELLDAGRKAVDRFPGIMDAAVQSQLYRALLEYYKANGPAAEYFSNSLHYLTYTPLESISTEEQIALATDVGTAALVGENIYNFGELLQHDVIKVLEGTPKAWLVELLNAFNAGDINAYEKVAAAVKDQEAVLNANGAFLNEKIRIMRLMELAFRRPSDERTISLSELATECQVAPDQMEVLLMRAFSLKVVKGVIDQVAGTVLVSWVQPRVMNTQQLETIRGRLDQWASKVKETSVFLEDNARELL